MKYSVGDLIVVRSQEEKDICGYIIEIHKRGFFGHNVTIQWFGYENDPRIIDDDQLDKLYSDKTFEIYKVSNT